MDQSHGRKLRPLLPSDIGSGSSSGRGNSIWPSRPSQLAAPMPHPRRAAVKIACEHCRHKRIKCDDQRPRCGQCTRRGIPCVYDSAEAEVSVSALKKKMALMQHENIQYRDLIGILRSRTDAEASGILSRMRAAEDPLSVLDAVREAEIILPAPWSTGKTTEHELFKLDQEAWENSDIRVPARPWTTVVGDGLVSELVSNYFTWENAYFFPTIDREIFQDEMGQGDIDNSSWCTPLLVNSICAHRSQTLGRAKIYSSTTRQSLAVRFLDEAESRLRSEQGRISIPTAQALMLRYFTMTCMGRDRIGRACRQQAVDIVHRLNLEAHYKSISGASRPEVMEKKRVCRALWGLFVVESRFAYFYLQPSQIPPPEIPQEWDQEDSETPDDHGNIDVLGRPFEGSPCATPLVAGILTHVCALSRRFYEVMKYNTREENERGSKEDIDVRKTFYSWLLNFENSLPQRFSPSHNTSPSATFLSMHLNELAFAIIQNQKHGIPFALSADHSGTTIKDLCLSHCQSDVNLSEWFLSHWPFEPCLWRHLYLSLQPLALMLDRLEGRQLFAAASAMVRAGCSNSRICGHLLQATQAFVWATGGELPLEARPHYEGCRESLQTQDLPLSFALPLQDETTEVLKGKSRRHSESKVSEDDLGSLIEAWTLE